MNVQISAPALAAIQRGLDEAPDMVHRELLAGMRAITIHLEGETADALRPPDVGASGALSESISSDAFTTPAGVLGVVGTPKHYAVVVEDGRRPGKGVSREGRVALAAWAVSKLGVPQKEADGVAYLIARKIKREGIKARKIFQNTLDQSMPAVVREFELAAGRIANQLAGPQ